MTMVRDVARPHDHYTGLPELGSSLVADWLGLAGYLAEAVTNGDTTIELAGAELAAAVTDLAEQRAVQPAVDVATRLVRDRVAHQLVARHPQCR